VLETHVLVLDHPRYGVLNSLNYVGYCGDCPVQARASGAAVSQAAAQAYDLAMRKAMLIAALLASLVPACSSAPGPGGPERAVFRIEMKGVQEHGPDPFDQLADVQVPQMYNQSSSTVRVASVRLLAPPKGVRVVRETAYRWSVNGVTPGFGDSGDLPKECPKIYKPHPVTAAVTAPHAYSNWIVILAMRCAKQLRPGKD
jgi:hypothetical protein